MSAIPRKAIFHERDGWVFYVANWQNRFTTGARATLVRLSPRHFAQYQRLKGRGRGQKSICYLLFKKKVPTLTRGMMESRKAARPSQRASQRDSGKMPTAGSDSARLSTEQLAGMIERLVGAPIASLRSMNTSDLRKLHRALSARR